jgi:hypothetical protein
MTVNAHDLIIQQLDQGKVVELDEFGIEKVEKVDDEACQACESPYRQTHGGFGSKCFECDEPWPTKEQSYEVEAQRTITWTIDIEAETPEEALEIARRAPLPADRNRWEALKGWVFVIRDENGDELLRED